jgi:hypothetical protein
MGMAESRISKSVSLEVLVRGMFDGFEVQPLGLE